MCYYDLRISYKNGSTKSVLYSCNDYDKAIRHAYRLSKPCKIAYVVDGLDYRIAFEKNEFGVDHHNHDKRPF